MPSLKIVKAVSIYFFFVKRNILEKRVADDAGKFVCVRVSGK